MEVAAVESENSDGSGWLSIVVLAPGKPTDTPGEHAARVSEGGE